MATGCHTCQSSKTSHPPKCGSQYHLPWTHWELAQNADSWAPLRLFHCQPQGAASLARRCSAVLLLLPSPSFHLGHSASSWSPVCFLWPPAGPSLTTFWPQGCPPGLWQWVISVCAHHSPGCSEMALADGLRDPNLTRRCLLSEGWLQSPGDLCSFTLHSLFYSEGLLGLHQT